MDLRFYRASEEWASVILDMMEKFNSLDDYPFDRQKKFINVLEFMSNPDLGRLWLIQLNAEIIGYLALTFGFSFEYGGRDAFLDELFIEAPFRGQGVGQKAMAFLLKQAEELEVNALHLEVENHNEAGLGLYQKNSFKSNGRILMTKLFIQETNS